MIDEHDKTLKVSNKIWTVNAGFDGYDAYSRMVEAQKIANKHLDEIVDIIIQKEKEFIAAMENLCDEIEVDSE